MTVARVALFHGTGLPFEIREYTNPSPAEGELAVRVICCTICGSDLHTHAGRRNGATPTVLGHEIVGRIEAFGRHGPKTDMVGSPLAVGDRISWSVAASCGACFFCENALPQKCDSLTKYGHHRATDAHPFVGGLADVVTLLPGTSIFRVSESITDEIAAMANCATATAAAVLRAAGSVMDRTVLVLGAGVLGVNAIAMARSAGARDVLVSDPKPAHRQRAIDFGATKAFSSDPTELAVGVADATQGRGADAVLELAGVPTTVSSSFQFARTGGTVVLAGAVLPTASVSLDPEMVVRRLLTIHGVHNYTPTDLAYALTFLQNQGGSFPFANLIVGRYSLTEVEKAFSFAHAHAGGRVVVRP